MGMTVIAANPGNVIAMALPLIITGDENDEDVAMMDQALEFADIHAE